MTEEKAKPACNLYRLLYAIGEPEAVYKASGIAYVWAESSLRAEMLLKENKLYSSNEKLAILEHGLVCLDPGKPMILFDQLQKLQ